MQERSKSYYDKMSKTPLKFQTGEEIYVKHNDKRQPATVVAKHNTPRSYIVEFENGSTSRRNTTALQRSSRERYPPKKSGLII